MPFEHIIDHEHRLVLVRGDGEGSMEEIADSARRLLEDQPIGTNYSFMFLVDDTALHPTSDQMWGIASLLQTLLSRFTGRMAIVTSDIGRVSAAHLITFGADMGTGRVRAFSTESDARGWLLQTTPE